MPRIDIDGPLEIFHRAVRIAAIGEDAAHLVRIFRSPGRFAHDAAQERLRLGNLPRPAHFAGAPHGAFDFVVAQLGRLGKPLGRLLVVLERTQRQPR